MVALGVVVLCGGAGLCQRWGMVSAQPPLCSAISLSSLQAKHTQEGSQTWGVNGESGALADMKELGVWEPLAVKLQTYKTAVEVRRADGRTDGRLSAVHPGVGNVTAWGSDGCAVTSAQRGRSVPAVGWSSVGRCWGRRCRPSLGWGGSIGAAAAARVCCHGSLFALL